MLGVGPPTVTQLGMYVWLGHPNFPRNAFFVQLSEAEMFDDFALFIVENPGPGGEMVCVCVCVGGVINHPVVSI